MYSCAHGFTYSHPSSARCLEVVTAVSYHVISIHICHLRIPPCVLSPKTKTGVLPDPVFPLVDSSAVCAMRKGI